VNWWDKQRPGTTRVCRVATPAGLDPSLETTAEEVSSRVVGPVSPYVVICGDGSTPWWARRYLVGADPGAPGGDEHVTWRRRA
jgi:hypothetical protein